VRPIWLCQVREPYKVSAVPMVPTMPGTTSMWEGVGGKGTDMWKRPYAWYSDTGEQSGVAVKGCIALREKSSTAHRMGRCVIVREDFQMPCCSEITSWVV
jgi:hypothetical protein